MPTLSSVTQLPLSVPDALGNSEAERVIVALVRSGMFSVDDEGRIWRHQQFTRTGRAKTVPTRRADFPRKDGYSAIKVQVGRRTYWAMSHRIVWLATIGPIPTGLEINHKDGKRSHNAPSNLEPMTPKQNTSHSYDVLNRPHICGTRIGTAKLDAERVAEIHRRVAAGEAKRALARAFGVSPTAIRKVVRGDNWKSAFPEV